MTAVGTGALGGSLFVVGVGGSNRTSSVTDQLLRRVLAEVQSLAGETVLFDGAYLGKLPVYGADEAPEADGAVGDFVQAVARADGLVIGSPGYHGGPSGLIKNALDHLELLRNDRRPYLEGRAVGLLVTASGWQATGTTLVALRSTIHALRGWPTPFAATINSAEPVYDQHGAPMERVEAAVQLLAAQVVDFARWCRAAEVAASTGDATPEQ
jgi:FMN reductase